jgi:hypothetical protein
VGVGLGVGDGLGVGGGVGIGVGDGVGTGPGTGDGDGTGDGEGIGLGGKVGPGIGGCAAAWRSAALVLIATPSASMAGKKAMVSAVLAQRRRRAGLELIGTSPAVLIPRWPMHVVRPPQRRMAKASATT